MMWKWVNSGLWPITKMFQWPHAEVQAGDEWGQHVSPETGALLTKHFLFIFMFRSDLLKLNTARWCGPKPGLWAPLWSGYILICRQDFQWVVYSKVYCEPDLTSESSGKCVICCFLLVFVGLAHRRTHQHMWLCRITIWKRQETAVLCGEAVWLKSMCLSTEQDWSKWPLNKGVELWQC